MPSCARQLRDLAARLHVPLGAILEGGYEPAALARCVACTLEALGDEQTARSVTPDPVLTSRAFASVAPHWTL